MAGSTVWYGFPPYNPVRQIFYFRIGLILVTVAQNYGVIFSRGNFRYCLWPFTVGVTVRQGRVGTDTVGIPHLLTNLPVPQIRTMTDFAVSVKRAFSMQERRRLTQIQHHFSKNFVSGEIQQTSFRRGHNNVFTAISQEFFIFQPLCMPFFFPCHITCNTGSSHTNSRNGASGNN